MKRNKLVIILISLIFILSACKQNTPDLQKDTSYTVQDSQNRPITLNDVPKRVISLAPTVTEIIFALGMEGTLVGRTDWCNYPEAVFSYESVGDMDVPSVEKIVSLKPDVVFMSEMTTREIAEQLQSAGITYFVVKNEESFEGAYQSIKMVADVLKKSEEAQVIINGMKEKVSFITDTIKDAPKPKVYYVMGFGEWGDFTAGKGTFISEIIRMAGGINVADDTEGWSYSLEKIVEHDPDILLCSMYSPPDQLKDATGYKALNAVKNDKMYVINDDMLQRLGPRLPDALYDVAKALHPDLFT